MCRSSLSSNSEGDDDMGRYSRSTFDPILSQTQANNSNMTNTPYMLSRDTGHPLVENGAEKMINIKREEGHPNCVVSVFTLSFKKNNIAARRVRENLTQGVVPGKCEQGV